MCLILPWLLSLSIANEPHHAIVYQNLKLRVMRLKLEPGEATALHRHDNYYAFFALRPVILSNEVPTHQPKVTQFETGEVHTSRGGFQLIERNISNGAADLILVELLNPSPMPFTTPIKPIFSGPLYSSLFETAGMRASSMIVRPGGRIQLRENGPDRLIIPVKGSNFRAGQNEELQWQAGDAHWFPAGPATVITNTGKVEAELVVFKFN